MSPRATTRKIERGRILILKEKHGTRYFDVADDEKLHVVALKIVAERSKGEYAYITDPGPLSRYPGCESPFTMTDEEITALPLALREDARQKRRNYARHKREWETERDQYTRARAAVTSKDGEDAYRILQERASYEYELIRFEFLENA